MVEQPTSAVAEHANNDFLAKFINKTPRRGRQHFSKKWGFQREWLRRRSHGGGQKRQCTVVREGLILWYSMIRHSVDVKIMCRFPKKVLLVKAQMLQQEYFISCVRRNVQPEHVQLDGQWLDVLLAEYKLSAG